MKRYDISTTLSSEQCLLLGQLLASVSNENTNFPSVADKLSSTVFKIKTPFNKKPFEYLGELIGEYFPEERIFEAILGGTADKNKSETLKASKRVIVRLMSSPQIVYYSPRQIGAEIELAMRREGFGMDPQKFGCGSSNINSQGGSLSYTESRYADSGLGESGDGLGPREFPCPACGHMNIRPFGGLVHRCQNPNCPKPGAVMCG